MNRRRFLAYGSRVVALGPLLTLAEGVGSPAYAQAKEQFFPVLVRVRFRERDLALDLVEHGLEFFGPERVYGGDGALVPSFDRALLCFELGELGNDREKLRARGERLGFDTFRFHVLDFS